MQMPNFTSVPVILGTAAVASGGIYGAMKLSGISKPEERIAASFTVAVVVLLTGFSWKYK